VDVEEKKDAEGIRATLEVAEEEEERAIDTLPKRRHLRMMTIAAFTRSMTWWLAIRISLEQVRE